MLKHIAPWLVLGTLILGQPGLAAAEMMTPEQARIALAKAKRREDRLARIKAYRARFKRQTSTKATPALQVPELDPSAAHGAFALLIGGVLVLGGRRRTRLSKRA